VDAPDVLGDWTALEGLGDGAGGGGICIGRDDGTAPGGVCMIWAPFALLEVADADATGMAVGGDAAPLLLLPALVIPLLLPLLAAVPLEDLKEDKRFCAEDLRRIER
jgi:hypothetical protein